MKKFFTIVLLLTRSYLSNGDNSLDSLWKTFNTKTDTSKVLAAFELSNHYYRQNPDTTIIICSEAAKVSEKLNFEYGKSESFGWLGYLYQKKGLTAEALKYFLLAYDVRITMADSAAIANVLNNIGYIYDSQKEYTAAFEHYTKALKIRSSIKDSMGISNSLNNIGYLHDAVENYDSALYYYNKSLIIRRSIRDAYGVAESYNNIASVYRLTEKFDSSLCYYEKSLNLNKRLNNSSGVAGNLISLSTVFINQGNHVLGEEYALMALELSKSNIDLESTKGSARLLYRIYSHTNKFKEALTMYELFVDTKDSLNEIYNNKSVIQQQTKYEFEKEQLLKEQEEKEKDRVIKEQTQRRDNLQYSVIFIVILIVFGLILGLGFLKISPRFAEGLIFFAFLIFFEFILVLTDPYIENFTGGAPGFKLIVNAVLAALIFPFHAFFERALKNKILK